MIFGSNRKKVAKTVLEETRPLVNMIKKSRPLPKNFWKDEYVLGFLGGFILLNIKLSSKQSLCVEDVGLAAIDVFKKLSESQDTQVANDYLSLQRAPTPAFEEGISNAIFIVSFANGLVTEDNASIQNKKRIQDARAFCHSMSLDASHAGIVGVILADVWQLTLRDRLNLYLYFEN